MSTLLTALVNLGATVLIECGAMLIFGGGRERALHCLYLNLLTNPLVNLLLLLWSILVGAWGYTAALAVLEASAVLTEAALYVKLGDFGAKKAFFVSLLLNAASFSAGFITEALGL